MTGDNRDSGYSATKWKFDSQIARVFDDMLERSIPQYEVMRKVVLDLALRYAVAGTDVVDVGCSRGEALARFEAVTGASNRLIGLEISPPMLEAARARFVDQIERGQVVVLEHDLRRGYPDGLEASVTLAVLSLQFVPIEYRQRIVRDIYRATRPGGVLVLVEKVLGDTAEIDETLVELYLRNKERRGYSPEDIERKRLALEGVLVPVTAKWNVELLRAGGFTDVDCVWRYLNFAAWLAIKG